MTQHTSFRQFHFQFQLKDGITALGKAHTRSAPSPSSLPKAALETVPMFCLVEHRSFPTLEGGLSAASSEKMVPLTNMCSTVVGQLFNISSDEENVPEVPSMYLEVWSATFCQLPGY